MSTSAERRTAFEHADAILALEGFVKTPEVALLQQTVIDGHLTFDQAVKAMIAKAKMQAESKSE